MSAFKLNDRVRVSIGPNTEYGRISGAAAGGRVIVRTDDGKKRFEADLDQLALICESPSAQTLQEPVRIVHFSVTSCPDFVLTDVALSDGTVWCYNPRNHDWTQYGALKDGKMVKP